MFGRMKDPVEGTARLVSYELTNVRNEFDQVIQAQVVVEAPGLEPTATEIIHGVPHGELPLMPGTTWRVKVDRKNPKKIKVLEPDADEAKDAVEAGRHQAEELAAAMRRGDGPAAGAPGATMPGVQVIGAEGVDPARVKEAMGRAEQALGMDLDGDGKIGGSDQRGA